MAALVAYLLALSGECGAETLDQVWRLAETRGVGVASARLESDAAREDARAAAADRWPSATLRSGYKVRSAEPAFVSSLAPLGGDSVRLPFAQRQAGLLSARASTPLWTAGRLGSAVDAADARWQAATDSAEWSAMELRMSVSEAYIAVLQGEQEVASKEQLSASAAAVEADVGEAFRTQRATDRDVASARATASKARQALLAAQHALFTSRARLNQLMGRPLQAHVAVCEPQIPPVAADLAELTAHAVENRPDVLELRRLATASRHDSEGWQAAGRPQVTLEMGFDYEENRFQTPQGVAEAGVFVNWSALDSGKHRRQSAAAEARAASLAMLLDDLRSSIAVEVLTAWNQRAETYYELQCRTDALSHADEQERWVRSRRDQGLAVAAELLQAEAQRLEAQTLLHRTRTNLTLSELELRLVSGRLGPDCPLTPAP